MTLDPLVVDIYAGDVDGKPDIAALVSAGYPWCGIILKATEGTSYPMGSARDWFLSHWLPARIYAQERYGVTWFRGAYHYARLTEEPVKQAEAFLYLVEEAGGWGPGDLWPMIDVEAADNPANISGQQVVDCVSAIAVKLATELGRTPMLYGGSLMYELAITSHMGCGTLLFPRYTAELPPYTYERIGWQLDTKRPTLWGWQICGDGEVYVDGYPKTTPIGKVDYSAVIVNGGGDDGLSWTRHNLAG